MAELLTHKDPPAQGRKLLIGGFTYSRAMMEPWAEEVGKLEGVTDVDTLTLVEALDNPHKLRVKANGALVEGHSGAGAAYGAEVAYKEAQPTKALEVKMIAAAEGRKSAARLLGGGVLLNTRQVSKAVSAPKAERAGYRRAVIGKLREGYRLTDLSTNIRAFRLIGAASTIEMLEDIHEVSGGRTRTVDVLLRRDQFGFGLTPTRIRRARDRGVEVIEIGNTTFDRGHGPVGIDGPPLDLDHETPVVFPKKTNHIINYERVAA